MALRIFQKKSSCFSDMIVEPTIFTCANMHLARDKRTRNLWIRIKSFLLRSVEEIIIRDAENNYCFYVYIILDLSLSIMTIQLSNKIKLVINYNSEVYLIIYVTEKYTSF